MSQEAYRTNGNIRMPELLKTDGSCQKPKWSRLVKGHPWLLSWAPKHSFPVGPSMGSGMIGIGSSSTRLLIG